VNIWGAIEPLMPDQGRRAFTADEALAVEEILDAAQHYADGKLPWWEAANMGGIETINGFSTGFGRFLALLWATANHDPRLPALTRLINELVTQSGVTVTRFGIIGVDELRQHDLTIRGAA
jgi:hypothetical protein